VPCCAFALGSLGHLSAWHQRHLHASEQVLLLLLLGAKGSAGAGQGESLGCAFAWLGVAGAPLAAAAVSPAAVAPAAVVAPAALMGGPCALLL
jgi:hypothetical protein